MLKVFVVEEYGYAYHIWEYPGTVDELVADYRAGRAPFGVEYDNSMPPKPLRRAKGEKRYRGECRRFHDEDLLLEVETQSEATMQVCMDQENSLFLKTGEQIVPDMAQPPKVEGTVEAIERGKECPETGMIAEYVRGGLGPWSHEWIAFHTALCKKCREEVAREISAARG